MAPEWRVELNQTRIEAMISAADTIEDDAYANHRLAYITGTAMLAMALFAGLVWCACSLLRVGLSRCCGAGRDASVSALCCGAEGDAGDCFGGRTQPCTDAEEEDEDVDHAHPREEDASDSAEDERTDESGDEGREEGPPGDEHGDVACRRGDVGRGHGSSVEVYRGPRGAAHGPS